MRSARECCSNHLEQLQGKYKHASQVITNLEKKIAAHRKYLQAVEQVNRKCPIVVEKLDFSQKKKRLRELSSRHNRMLSNFAYSKFLQLLKARCFKKGIELIEVNPAYSSLIGLIKFMSMYGMNSATAAAHVLARRAMYLSERPPARTAYQGTEPRKHIWSHWGSINKRVKGTSRHSFYLPRPRVESRLRPVRGSEPLGELISAVDNLSRGAWRSW